MLPFPACVWITSYKTQQLFCLWLIFNANEPQRQGSHYDYEVLYNGEAEAGLLHTIDQCISDI